MFKVCFTAFLFLLPNISYCGSYDESIKVAAKAAFIQSGYEADLIRIQNVASANANSWLKAKGLSGVAATVGFVAPVIIYKRVEVHSGNFTFTGKNEVKELNWQFSF